MSINNAGNGGFIWLQRIIVLVVVVLHFISGTSSWAETENMGASAESSDTLTIPPDSGLAKALKAALTLHPSVRGQQALLEGAAFNQDASFAQRLPTLSFDGDTLGEQNQGTLVVQQPLWSFGRIDTQVNLAKAGLRTEQIALLQVRRDLLEETALAYASIDGLRRQMAVAEENIEAHRTFHDRIVRRQKGGVASEADVQFAYGRLVRAESTLVNYQGQLAVAESRLRALTLADVDTRQAVSPDWFDFGDDSLLEQLIIDSSADMLTARQRLVTAELSIEQAKYESMPTLAYQIERDMPNDPEVSDHVRHGLTLQASFGGLGYGSYSSVRSYQAQRTAAQQEVQATEVELRREVQSLQINLAMQLRLQTAQAAAVSAVRETLASFIRQYETDRKSWIEVLNTQRELSQEQLELVSIESSVLEARLQLASMAGLLDSTAQVAALPPLPVPEQPWKLQHGPASKFRPLAPVK